ncbi:MAG TPA: hypothetical protein VIS56_00175 [Candidatus Saccharimonadales bacterium]
MFDELNRAIDEYQSKWNVLVAQRKNKDFFERLKPTAAAWKAADQAAFDQMFGLWRTACDYVVVTWLNERWYAVMHLKTDTLSGGLEIIKLMQRRPNSTDATGLDHIDFLDTEETNTKAVLAEEPDIKWSEESNGDSKWTSIWFEGTEAKLRQETPLDIDIAELQQINNKIRGHKFARPTGDGAGPHIAEVE